MASLDDLFATAKNLVVAYNNLTNTYLTINGSLSSSGISVNTVVKPTSGRICTVSVVTAGSAAGAIYDASVTGITTNPVFTIPMTVGLYVVNIPTQNGIVVAPGSGQVVSLGYS